MQLDVTPFTLIKAKRESVCRKLWPRLGWILVARPDIIITVALCTVLKELFSIKKKKNQFSPACDLAGDKCWFSSGRANGSACVSASRYGDCGSELNLVGSGREMAFPVPDPCYL